MKTIQFLFASVISVALVSCGNNPPTTPSPTPQETVSDDHEHAHDHSSEAIELNNGEKWAVNEEMKPFVQSGMDALHTFIENKETNYTALAEKLKGENKSLIKSCTMDGKSHDELHKWLHPHLELVAELEKSKDAAESQKIVEKLRDSYKEYGEYFQ